MKRRISTSTLLEKKKMWNMKVMIVPIVIETLGTITKGLLKGLEDLEVGGRVETIQMTALQRTVRILRQVLETWVDMLSLRLLWKTIIWHWCENLWKSIIMIMIIIIIIIKENFAVPADHRIKLKECEKDDKSNDLVRELKKTNGHEGDNYTNCDRYFCYSN